MLPAAPVEREVGSDSMLIGALGKATFKLTAAQEKILNRPVDRNDVRVKPTGQVYLSHPSYTRWFNEALGRGQWALVPAGKPSHAGGSVNVPYVLYINGTPAAFAMGEQEYYEGNKQQTLGDAIEASVASGLRRCAKRLGVGLELWDRQWANAFIEERAIAVRVQRRDQKGTAVQWRLKTDPPFPGELAPGSRPMPADDVIDAEPVRPSAPAPPAKERERAYTDETRGQKISEPQVRRLFGIAKSVGRTRAEIELWLNATRGYESAADIKRSEYDAIVKRIESPGALEG